MEARVVTTTVLTPRQSVQNSAGIQTLLDVSGQYAYRCPMLTTNTSQRKKPRRSCRKVRGPDASFYSLC